MTEAWPDEALPLFREPPEGFIAARNDLVRRLREDDRSDDAAAVKALRKPTVVTWVLNQLATRDAEGVAMLEAAGADVRAVQRAALSSATDAGARLKAATAARRTAITRLTEVARGVLAEVGTVSSSHVDAIRRALETASTDAEVAGDLRAGTLQRTPLEAAGFGDLAGLTLVPDPSGEPAELDPGAAAATGTDRASPAAQPKPRAAERTRLRRDRDAAVRAARKARESADRYAREHSAMQERLEVVEQKHLAAESDASAKELTAKRAERALADADD